MLALAVTLSAGIATYLTAADKPDKDGWLQLFDGKTLDGWVKKGGTAEYVVKDGVMIGTTVEGSANTFLTKGPFSDFILEFEVLCDLKLNSGVQIRSQVFDEPKKMNLIMELVTGGELFDRIVDRGSYSEKDAADTMIWLRPQEAKDAAVASVLSAA